MLSKLFLTVILISGGYVYAQQMDNKATITDVARSSTGITKNGKADGEDIYKEPNVTDHDLRLKNIKSIHKKPRPQYRIINSRYVSRSTIIKSINTPNEVKIRIMQNGTDNTGIEDFSLAYDSGNEYRMSNIYGIENISLPLYVIVAYRSWNAFRAVQFDVNYEFVIYSPGTWNVTIFN